MMLIMLRGMNDRQCKPVGGVAPTVAARLPPRTGSLLENEAERFDVISVHLPDVLPQRGVVEMRIVFCAAGLQYMGEFAGWKPCALGDAAEFGLQVVKTDHGIHRQLPIDGKGFFLPGEIPPAPTEVQSFVERRRIVQILGKAWTSRQPPPPAAEGMPPFTAPGESGWNPAEQAGRAPEVIGDEQVPRIPHDGELEVGIENVFPVALPGFFRRQVLFGTEFGAVPAFAGESHFDAGASTLGQVDEDDAMLVTNHKAVYS